MRKKKPRQITQPQEKKGIPRLKCDPFKKKSLKKYPNKRIQKQRQKQPFRSDEKVKINFINPGLVFKSEL